MAGGDPILRNLGLVTGAVGLGVPLGAQVADMADGDTSVGEVTLNQLISILAPAAGYVAGKDFVDDFMQPRQKLREMEDRLYANDPEMSRAQAEAILTKMPNRRKAIGGLAGTALGALLAAKVMKDKPAAKEN